MSAKSKPPYSFPHMRPMLSYYGGKWQAAGHYPPPRFGTIVEPFAGGAGYSLRYYNHRVILVEKNPTVAAVWRYLISASPQRILSLPDVTEDGVDALDGVSTVEKWLIGFWLNAGVAAPRVRPSLWACEAREGTWGTPVAYWGPERREVLAASVQRIRHWKVIEGDYTMAPDVYATWFIDPPYQHMGKYYPCSFSDFESLGPWCRERKGEAIVCENDGASWLPFEFLTEIASTKNDGSVSRKSKEVMWYGGTHARKSSERKK